MTRLVGWCVYLPTVLLFSLALGLIFNMHWLPHLVLVFIFSLVAAIVTDRIFPPRERANG